MNIKSKQIFNFFSLLILLIFYGCSTEFEVIDNSVGTHFGIKNKGPKVKTFKGTDATQMKNKLEQMMGKSSSFNIFRNSGLSARGSENLEIDFSEIMEVIDTLGVKNYTFKILNHPDDSFKIFHNLVITEKDENLKLNLIKYEMTDEFALGYHSNSEKFVDFKGTVSSIPIGLDPSIDPCEPLIIEIPDTQSGGSGYDGSGDNTGSNPGSGDNYGSSGASGSGGGCLSMMIICTGNSKYACGATYNSWDQYSAEVCSNGNYNYKIVIQIFSCRLASDPCAEDDGLVGILPVDIEELIEDKIDDSLLDECTKDILNKLKDLQQNDIAEIMKRFDRQNSVFNMNFSQVPNLVNSQGQTLYGQCTGTDTSLTYDIKLNANFFKNDGATNLGKATTVLHEIMHALIFSVVDNSSNPSPDIDDFPAIWNAFVVLKTGTNNDNSHTIMGNHYVNIMGAALQEYDTGIPVPDGQTPQQLYTDLAWSGLFRLNMPNPFPNLTSTDRARILSRKNAEMLNEYNNGVYPTNNPSCLD